MGSPLKSIFPISFFFWGGGFFRSFSLSLLLFILSFFSCFFFLFFPVHFFLSINGVNVPLVATPV